LRSFWHKLSPHCNRRFHSTTKMEIQLTDREKDLFAVLLGCVKHNNKNTTLRVAGGWVRDKLLMQQSVDIDIALDDQTGTEFANSLNDYLKYLNMETRTICVIQANPDQSKHLETANVRVMGYEIDCVNLRAETYTDSRIPEIRNGTAHEDALRRDFTINALFYNLNTEQVEDFTEQGIPDLQKGLIRTPISPHITFQDDPLRILRAIRFASRFNFTLDAELVEAAQSPAIQQALNEKVSRERVYKECEGCMSKGNSRPYLAFHYMHRLNLLGSILPVESVLHHFPLVSSATMSPSHVHDLQSTWTQHAIRSLYWVNLLLSEKHQLHVGGPDSVAGVQSVGGDIVALSAEALATPKQGAQVKVLFWSAATARFAGLQVTEKGKTVPFVPVLLRESLKMENVAMKQVQTMLECVDKFTALADASESAAVPIETAGLLLRTCKELWRDCILLACSLALSSTSSSLTISNAGSAVQCAGVKRNLSDSVVKGNGEGAAGAAVDSDNAFEDTTLTPEQVHIVNKYRRLEHHIHDMGLDNIWSLAPLLNGKDLMKELGVKGPAVGNLLEQQILWQIRNQANPDREACLAYLRTCLTSK